MRGPFWCGRPVPIDEVARRAPFPLYGLAPEWPGERRLHSHGLSAGEVTFVALGHVDDHDGELVVHTLFGERRAPNDAPFTAVLHLAAEPPQWHPRTMVVEGRDQVFWGSEEGDRWAAFARVGGVRVVVTATRWSVGPGDVRLAVVDPVDYSGSTTSR